MVLVTRFTYVALPVFRTVMEPAFLDLKVVTMGAVHPIGPAQVAHHFIAFRLIDQVQNVLHRKTIIGFWSMLKCIFIFQLGSDPYSGGETRFISKKSLM